MNRAEAKILHGLYFHREMIGEELTYTAAEIRWLAQASYSKGRKWAGSDGKLRSMESPGDDYLARASATSADALRHIKYLAECGYINYSSTGKFHIAVTAKGADMARELGSCYGRINLLYKENKDGLLWLIATVLVSMVTSLLTS